MRIADFPHTADGPHAAATGKSDVHNQSAIPKSEILNQSAIRHPPSAISTRFSS
jgi:hypothetical protein